MDDTPKAFLEELRLSVLKRRVGQIALAVVLAQAVWRLISAFTWYVIIPVIDILFGDHTESVLSQKAAHPFIWQNMLGSLAEFLLTIIGVFYLNRWIQRKPSRPTFLETPGTEEARETDREYTTVGED